MTPGRCTFIDLEVLKFYLAEEGLNFHWSKVGSRRQFYPSIYPNVLSFSRISEDDLGYYRCEVKERGMVILTVYRALYRDESNSGMLYSNSADLYMYIYIVCGTIRFSFM